MDDELTTRMLRARGVDPRDACSTCSGYGVRTYGSTSTWRGGMGGARCTRDVCDACWGSGDVSKKWADLRAIENNIKDQVAKRALTALVDSCGAMFASTRDSTIEIIAALDTLARRRKVAFGTQDLANGLANTLRRAIGTPEVKL